MTGQIEAQNLFLHSEHFFFTELGDIRQGDTRFGRALIAIAIEQAALATAPIRQHRGSGLHRTIDRSHELCALSTHRIERACFDEGFNRRTTTGLRIDAFAEVEQIFEWTVLLACGHDRVGRPAAAAFYSAEA